MTRLKCRLPRGPRASQAVNLLRARSLEEAQALVECSFGNYLSGGKQKTRDEEVAALQMKVRRRRRRRTASDSAGRPCDGRPAVACNELCARPSPSPIMTNNDE